MLTSQIEWFTSTTKRGSGHNWEGTSNRVEGGMFDQFVVLMKEKRFVIKEIMMDKDAFSSATFSHHFPEGTTSYFSNHSAKTFRCDVRIPVMVMYANITFAFNKQCRGSGLQCKRITEGRLSQSKTALST